MITLVGPLRHVVQALANYAQALADLLHTHCGAIIGIALVAQRHLEFELVIAAVGPVAAQIEVHASGAQ